MARPAPPGALELLLHKATDPSNVGENWECIQSFCDQVNAGAEGPMIALRLLEHKIQSPQEAEALQALTVLETCVNNCGKTFHKEMSKFRFLNCLIKVLSPKYLGDWSTDRVKSRIVEAMFSWTVWFPQETKIQDAYQMLKKQGLVKQDPKRPEDKILPPPSARPASSIFDADNEKSKRLTRLLKSTNPEDLHAANRLIKGLIKEDLEKSTKVSRQVEAIKEAHSSSEALEEMLRAYKARDREAIAANLDVEALQSLRAKCEKLKPTMFRVASETEDDEVLAKILQANDRLTQALHLYKEVVVAHGDPVRSSTNTPGSTNSFTLIDFSEGHAPPTTTLQGNARIESFPSGPPTSLSANLLDEELISFGLPNSPGAGSAFFDTISRGTPQPPCNSASAWDTLAKLFIPLDSITLSTIPPVVAYEQNGLRVMLYFAKDPVPSHPSIQVLVLSLLSTAPHTIRDIAFQAAVPKSMVIKLQPATGSELPAFNPLLPPPMISQVLLLANPHKVPLRLRYRLLFTQNDQPCSEVGEVTNFPHAQLWGGS